MSVLVTMLSLSHTLLFSSLILKVMSSDLPPAYGLDLGDGKGIQGNNFIIVQPDL